MERIGVLGLGRMGQEIARRLAVQGAQVTGWTRSGLDEGRAAELGTRAAATPEAAAAASDVLILSLFDDDAVRSVMESLMATDLSGRLIIDTSTVSPQLLQSLAKPLAAAGAEAVDAPIAGGPEMVANATCGVFIGGSDAAFARAERIVSLYAGKVLHTGDLGTGMSMKIVNNAMLAGIFATLSEIVQIAKRAGLDYETTLQVLAHGPAGPPFLKARLERALGRDDSVGFAIAGVNKDIGVFRAAAADLGVETPMLARAAEIGALAQEAGLDEKDAAALIRAAWDRG